MAIVPSFVKKRASKEFNRGYSPKTLLKGFLGVTLLVAVADAGSVSEGFTNWMTDNGSRSAAVAEAAVPVASVALDGTVNAVESFSDELDVDVETPSVDVQGTNVGVSESGNVVQPGEGWQGFLMRAYGIDASSAMECYDNQGLNEVMLYAGQQVENPCN
jgi:hypothetical protein